STAPDDKSLFEVTQGLPLYVIESARAEVGRNESLTAVLEGSPRVQAVLDGRLDQLGQEASSIAGLAAVIGQEFTPDLLERASDLPADRVVDGLDELWRRRIIVHHRRGTYGFSHELLRDASLRRVPPPRLASLHRRVAEALQDTGVDAGTRAGRIADHYEQAGLSERALPFHEQAASLAVERFAHDAAIDHFHAACRLLGSLPPGEERDRHELRLRHLVSAPLNARYGFASRELQDEVERGLELAERLHDRRLEVVSLVGLFSSFVVQGRVVEAYEVARRALAASDGQPEVLGQVHFAVGGSAMMLGRLDEGIEQFDLVPQLAMDRPAAVVGTRPEVHSAAWQGHTLWLVGRGEEARERLQWARERAEELDHVFSLAVALAYAAMHAQFEEDQERVVELAGLTSELCAKHGFRYYGDWAHILAGWASGGRIGLATIQDGLAGLNSQRAYIRRSYYLTLRADLELSEGMEDAARRTLRQAHELAIEKSDLWWLPEVLRRRALLEPEQVAKDLLQEACAVAEAQGSVTLARRAQADLAAFGQR
ncbi:MAG TPA: SARP family transcriptional regulator, partial [Actinomycetes bacterium]|nr:SARP family transcriptional regulator [Actinomycetes bacterium]